MMVLNQDQQKIEILDKQSIAETQSSPENRGEEVPL